MTEDRHDPEGERSQPVQGGESMLEMIRRAYDRGRVAVGGSVVASDFRLELSPARQQELDEEREAVRSRVFEGL